MSWVQEAIAAAKAGRRVVLVTVVAAEGSSPREAGAKMLVFEDQFLGTIGGGGLEMRVLEEARRFAAREGIFLFEDIPLGPDLGQCCGGFVHLVYERISRGDLGWLKSWQSAEAGLAQGELRSAFGDEPSKIWREVAVDVSRTRFDSKKGVLIESVRRQRQPVWIFGSGHVGGALAPVLAELDFDVTVVDDRKEWLEKIDRDDVTRIFSLVPEGEVSRVPSSAFVIAMTPTHGLDFDICAAALAREDLPYVGMIGSKSKRVQALRHFKAQNISEASLARFVSPIGLEGLRDKRPAAIAVSVGVQLLRFEQVQSAKSETLIGEET